MDESDIDNDSSSSESSESSEDDELNDGNEVMKNFIFYLFCLDPKQFVEHGRTANIHRDRQGALNFIISWSDDMFQRQFRLC